ncbi:MAG: alpha/beta hydrolase family protein [Mycobacteriales bacterium]
MGAVDGFLLTPGAGADSNQATLVAIGDGLAPLPVHRMDFPYRVAGKKVPDRAPVLIDAVRRGVAEFAEVAGLAAERLALGGRSMGGRMCSMAVAEGLPAKALVLLSYPLHPPGKPEKRRTDHFPDLDVPCLFVSGTKDPFGTPAEFDDALAAIPGPVTMVCLDGQGHSPRNRETQIVGAISDFFAGLA